MITDDLKLRALSECDKLHKFSKVLFDARIVGLEGANEQLEDMLDSGAYADQWLDEVAYLIRDLLHVAMSNEAKSANAGTDTD